MDEVPPDIADMNGRDVEAPEIGDKGSGAKKTTVSGS